MGIGAANQTRTGTLSLARDFKSLVSTYSTITAYLVVISGLEPTSIAYKAIALTD